jgi:hypothetical protein
MKAGDDDAKSPNGRNAKPADDVKWTSLVNALLIPGWNASGKAHILE